MEVNKAYLMVRAQVPSESERAKFDQWYGTHHLPLAMDTLHADKGWRFWSRSDPPIGPLCDVRVQRHDNATQMSGLSRFQDAGWRF